MLMHRSQSRNRSQIKSLENVLDGSTEFRWFILNKKVMWNILQILSIKNDIPCGDVINFIQVYPEIIGERGIN